MPTRVRDCALGALVAVVVVGAVVACVFSAAGLGGRGGVWGRLGEGAGWLALAGLVLLIGVACWSQLRVRGLRQLLASRDDQLAAVGLTSHDWLWESSPELVATGCSPATAEMSGRRPEDIIGRGFPEFLAEEERPRIQAIVADAIAHRRGWVDEEVRWIHADGHAVVLQGSAVPVLDARGNLVGFRGTRRIAPVDAVERRRLVAATCRIRDVVDRQRLVVALQPIIDIGTGRWSAVEALARFADNRRPDLWFAEAHETGMGLDLELLAVTAALATLADLPDHVSLSVNASPGLIVDPRLAACLIRPGLPLERIIVEITEHAAVADYGDIRAALLPLRERGLRLAIDDTGAGYASFSHVLTLRPDIIKLDRSLIADIDTDLARRAFVTAIVLLALELGASVTAEGVETQEQLRFLAAEACDEVQGYLIGHPRPISDYSEVIGAKQPGRLLKRRQRTH